MCWWRRRALPGRTAASTLFVCLPHSRHGLLPRRGSPGAVVVMHQVTRLGTIHQITRPRARLSSQPGAERVSPSGSEEAGPPAWAVDTCRGFGCFDRELCWRQARTGSWSVPVRWARSEGPDQADAYGCCRPFLNRRAWTPAWDSLTECSVCSDRLIWPP